MTPTAPLVPADCAQDTVESLYAEHGADRRAIYWLVLLAAISSLAVLPLVKVDVSIRAPGIVRPATERTDLKAARGGRVARLQARDGDRVTVGQALLEIATPELDERLKRTRALALEKRDLIADLAGLLATEPKKPDPTGTESAGAANEAPSSDSSANRVFLSYTIQREYAQFLAQLHTARVALAKARATYARVSTLQVQGIVTDQERDDARFNCERAQADAALVIRQNLSAWQTRLRTERIEADQLASDEQQLLDEKSFATVRAPVTGAVQGLIGLSEGTYLLAGQSLGSISPDDRLLVEAYLSAQDIGLVHVGQTARLQLDPYPYTQWGLLDAIVERLPPDATFQDSRSTFKVILSPQALTLRLPDGTQGTLAKGMTLTARLVLAKRSVLQLLTEDVHSWADPRGAPTQ